MLIYIPRGLALFFCGLLCVGKTVAQLHPQNNSHLNYTSVCFAFPWMEDASSYELKLTNEQTKATQIYTFRSNKYIVNNLPFGTSYTWSVTGKNAQGLAIRSSEKIRFSIDESEKTGHSYIRFKEITNDASARGKELLVFDYAQVAMDKNLNVVWYLPNLPFVRPNSGIRDLKLTQDGTFLAIIDSNALELDLEGNILWQAPNDGKVSGQKGREDYHHEFQKLPSGNYMVLGNERIRHRFPGETDTVTYESGTIIEYNPKGQVVWEWHAKDFFTEALLMLRHREDGTVDPATHLNACNVSGKYLFAGFRDAGWILKIDKQTKQVVELYGGRPSGLPNHFGTGLFRYQHDARVLRDGSIAVINNDSIKDPHVYSSLVVFSQGEKGRDKGEQRFSFPFNYDTLTSGKSLKLGNVNELSNGNYLVNMGAINRVFEVTPAGKIVWDVFIDKLDTFKQVWRFFPQYRVATASSLYPNEFSWHWKPADKKESSISGELTVFNIGTETNAYAIYVCSGNTAPKELKQIPAIAPNASRNVTISIPQKHLQSNGEVSLLIQVVGKSKREMVKLR